MGAGILREGGRQTDRFSQVDDDIDVLQDLLLHGVGAVELEDDMGVKDVLDAEDAVLCLLLCQLLRCARLEQLPIHGKLGDGPQLRCVVRCSWLLQDSL